MPRRPRLGKLPPRYCFALNPFPEVRWSRCPRCDKPMHARKFPLLIYVEDAGLVALGKTCRYCTPCELIIAHQEEIETELTILFDEKLPEAVGNEYFVMGTVEVKTWRKSLAQPLSIDELLAHAADVKHPLVVADPRPRLTMPAGR